MPFRVAISTAPDPQGSGRVDIYSDILIQRYVVYRFGRIIGQFTLDRMVGHILTGSSNVIIGVFCELLRS